MNKIGNNIDPTLALGIPLLFVLSLVNVDKTASGLNLMQPASRQTQS
jgi:hypothetical protein